MFPRPRSSISWACLPLLLLLLLSISFVLQGSRQHTVVSPFSPAIPMALLVSLPYQFSPPISSAFDEVAGDSFYPGASVAKFAFRFSFRSLNLPRPPFLLLLSRYRSLGVRGCPALPSLLLHSVFYSVFFHKRFFRHFTTRILAPPPPPTSSPPSRATSTGFPCTANPPRALPGHGFSFHLVCLLHTDSSVPSDWRPVKVLIGASFL